VTEPSGGVALSSLGDRAMNRFVYRRFADHESLVFSHSVTATPGGGVRWYELRTPSNPTVFQQGTFAPDGAYRWEPSAAMDGAGGIAAIYTVSSSTIFPGIRFATRGPDDPLGMLTGEGSIVEGTAVQTGISRWGDYASLNIDPVDDCTFWGTHEYKKVQGGGNWQSRIASFQLPSCSSFAVAALDAETVTQGRTASYPVSTTAGTGNPQMVQLSATGLPSGVTATFDPPTVMSGGSSMIKLVAATDAAVGATHYTVVANGTVSSVMSDVMLTVEAQPTMPDAGANNGGKAHAGCCDVSGGRPMSSIALAVGVMLVLRRRRSRR
jgi:hypothetical protein